MCILDLKKILLLVFQAYWVDNPWTPSAITWNNNPSYDEEIYTSTSLQDTEDENWYYVDVTDFAKNWLTDCTLNNGVMLKAIEETDATNLTKFYSSDAWAPYTPELVINYQMYYGSRPYQHIGYTTDVNCMGYALEYREYITKDALDINDSAMFGMTLAQMECYIQDKIEMWMDTNLGASNYSQLYGYESNIYEDWFRVVFRVKHEDNDNDMLFSSGDEFDVHWWYQTSNGIWAEKQAMFASVCRDDLGIIDPTTIEWSSGINICYSGGVFYLIKDIRTGF